MLTIQIMHFYLLSPAMENNFPLNWPKLFIHLIIAQFTGASQYNSSAISPSLFTCTKQTAAHLFNKELIPQANLQEADKNQVKMRKIINLNMYVHKNRTKHHSSFSYFTTTKIIVPSNTMQKS